MRAKEQKLTSQHKKFYKVHLPKDELDKFKPSKGHWTENFSVHMVFSSKFFEKASDKRMTH